MTYFISIDAAKYEHIASCYSHSTGELIVNSLHFNHNDKGFNSLWSVLSELDDRVVDFKSSALALKIEQAIETLEYLKKQIDEVTNEIMNHPSVRESPFHKINGMNSVKIAYIISAIMNISRFNSIKKGCCICKTRSYHTTVFDIQC